MAYLSLQLTDHSVVTTHIAVQCGYIIGQLWLFKQFKRI